MPPSLTSFQRACVVIGFLCLSLSLVALVFDRAAVDAAAIAVIGLCWLVGSRLAYRD